MNQTSNRLLKNLAVLVILLISGFVILSVMVHLFNPGINPVRFPLSRYGIAPNGYLLFIGLFLIGLAELIVGILVYNEENILRTWLMLFLLLMGITAFITAILPMDIEPAHTFRGTVHIYAAGIQFILYSVSALLYGFRHPDHTMRLFSTCMGIAALVILPFITLTVLTENPVLLPVYGLLQKIYILMITAWLGIIANYKLRNAV